MSSHEPRHLITDLHIWNIRPITHSVCRYRRHADPTVSPHRGPVDKATVPDLDPPRVGQSARRWYRLVPIAGAAVSPESETLHTPSGDVLTYALMGLCTNVARSCRRSGRLGRSSRRDTAFVLRRWRSMGPEKLPEGPGWIHRTIDPSFGSPTQ